MSSAGAPCSVLGYRTPEPGCDPCHQNRLGPVLCDSICSKRSILFSRCPSQSASHPGTRDTSPLHTPHAPRAALSRLIISQSANYTVAMNAHFAPPGAAWQEHRTPDGRVYYFNPLTKVTQWTKPEDLMSPAEVCVLRRRREGAVFQRSRADVSEPSVRSQISHGKSTRPRVVASTGTTPRPRRARGRCPTSTRELWLVAKQHRLPQREHSP